MAPSRRADTVTALAVCVLAACGSPPSTSTGSALPAAAIVAPDPRLELQALTARGDWSEAVKQYRRALAAHPDDPALHFGLGSALTHLDRVAEAAEEFAWVVKRAPASSAEVAAAREWLIQAGLLPDGEAPHSAGAAQPEGVPATTPAGSPGARAGDDEMNGIPYGTVRGVTRWPGITAQSNVRLDIGLTGADERTAGKRYPLHIRLGQPYTLTKIPAGAWRLVAKSDATALWETRVVVEPSKETVVDLTPDTSVVSPSHFAPR